MNGRPRRKRQVGIVTSDKMDKTIAVRVDWLYKVPKYGKRVRRHTTYYAHDEANTARVGDRVEIVASRPLSRLKRWRLARVLRRSAVVGEMPGLPAEEQPMEPPERLPGEPEPAAVESEPQVPGDQPSAPNAKG